MGGGKAVLRQQKGVVLLVVLCVFFILAAISSSTFFSAAASLGAANQQTAREQAYLSARSFSEWMRKEIEAGGIQPPESSASGYNFTSTLPGSMGEIEGSMLLGLTGDKLQVKVTAKSAVQERLKQESYLMTMEFTKAGDKWVFQEYTPNY